MFESLSGRLGDVFDRLKRRGALREADVEAALRDIRVALLEADGAARWSRISSARSASARSAMRSCGASRPARWWSRSCTTIWSICWAAKSELNLSGPPPARDPDGRPAGLGQDHHQRQARLSAAHEGRRALWPRSTCSARPPRSSSRCSRTRPESRACRSCPVRRRSRSRARGRDRHALGDDVVILDTAGRLHIDEALMAELEAIRDRVGRTRRCWWPTR